MTESARAAASLGRSADPLDRRYDLAMLDLDGVVYVGADAVPGAPQHVAAAREAGMRIAFITNNAARPPATVAEQLRGLGVDADADDVVTSAQAAARLLVERLGPGARVVVLGAEGLVEAVSAAGLEPVEVEDDAEAVVTGYGPDVRWRHIMRAGVRIRDGLWWVACNTDLTIPTAYGVAPGHGVLVETLRRFSGVDPDVAGKPARPLLDETVRRCGGERPLMVGDRLDTDIEGAHAAGRRLAAGPDRRDRAGRARRGGAGAAADVPRCGPRGARPPARGARGLRGRGGSGRLDRTGGRRGARGEGHRRRR